MSCRFSSGRYKYIVPWDFNQYLSIHSCYMFLPLSSSSSSSFHPFINRLDTAGFSDFLTSYSIYSILVTCSSHSLLLLLSIDSVIGLIPQDSLFSGFLFCLFLFCQLFSLALSFHLLPTFIDVLWIKIQVKFIASCDSRTPKLRDHM